MGSPALKASVELDEKDLIRGLAASEESLAASQEKAKLLAAQIALLEQTMAKGSTDELRSQHKLLQKSLQETKADAVAAERQLKALSAVKPPEVAAPPVAKPQDDSAAYEAHWKRLEEESKRADEKERSRKAHEGMARIAATPAKETLGPVVAPDPADRARLAAAAKIEAEFHSRQLGDAEAALAVHRRSVGSGASDKDQIKAHEERIETIKARHKASLADYEALRPKEDPEPEKPGNNRMRNQEIGHIVRSISDSIMAGHSPLRAVGQEAPRILQAFGTNILSLLKNITPLAAVSTAAAAAVGGLAIAISKAHTAALARSEMLDAAGRPDSSIGGDTQEHARGRVAELEQPIAKARADSDSSLGFGDAIVAGRRAAEPINQAIANAVARVPLFGASLRMAALADNNPGNTTGETLSRLQQDQATRVTHESQVHARDNTIAAKSASQGVDVAVSDQLEREFEQRKEEIEKLVAANPLLGDTELLKQLREEIDLRKKIAEAQHDQIENQYALAHRTSQIKIGGDPNGTVDGTELLSTDLHSKALSEAQERIDAANSHVAKLMSKHLDTRDAERERDAAYAAQHETIFNAEQAFKIAKAQTEEMSAQVTGYEKLAALESLRASYADRIRASEEAGTTELTKQLKAQQEIASVRARAEAYREGNDPAALAKAARQRTKEEQDARHFDDHGRTHDADRDGSNVGIQADLPDTSAAESLDNAAADLTPRHMDGTPVIALPALPDRRPAIDSGAQSAGNGDEKGGVDNAGIIKAINTPEWTKNFGLKNK